MEKPGSYHLNQVMKMKIANDVKRYLLTPCDKKALYLWSIFFPKTQTQCNYENIRQTQIEGNFVKYLTVTP